MIKNILLYNSGGGIGDSLQILPLINTLKYEFKGAKLYYLSAHENHFNSTLKDFNSQIETLNLNLLIFILFNISKIDLIIIESLFKPLVSFCLINLKHGI